MAKDPKMLIQELRMMLPEEAEGLLDELDMLAGGEDLEDPMMEDQEMEMGDMEMPEESLDEEEEELPPLPKMMRKPR